MPKVLFAGGESESYNLLGGAPVEATTAGTFDSAYARASMYFLAPADAYVTAVNANGVETPIVTGETGFFHFAWYAANSYNLASNIVILTNAAGDPLLALRFPGGANNGVVRWMHNTGTAASPVWTAISGTVYSFPNNTLHRHDLKITLGSPHTFEWSVNGSFVASGTFTNAAITSLSRMRMAPAQTSYFSELLITEGYSTVNGRVRTMPYTGIGTANLWTGAYTDINEIVLSDASAIISSTADQLFSFNATDITVPAGFVLRDIFLNTRAKHDGVSPLNLQGIVRSGGANHPSGNIPGVTTSFTSRSVHWPLDPATGLTWTQAGANAAEFGSKSIA